MDSRTRCCENHENTWRIHDFSGFLEGASNLLADPAFSHAFWWARTQKMWKSASPVSCQMALGYVGPLGASWCYVGPSWGHVGAVGLSIYPAPCLLPSFLPLPPSILVFVVPLLPAGPLVSPLNLATPHGVACRR